MTGTDGHSGAPVTAGVHGDLDTQLHDLRAKALQGLLVVSAVVASVAWFPGVYAAWTSGLMSVVVLDTVMWIVVIVLALWRSLGYAVRAAAFCTVWLLFSAALLWILGPVGAGVAWLLALPVLTTLFYGAGGAAAGVGAIVVVGITGAIALANANGVGGMAAIGGPVYTMEAWLASLGSVAFLAVILALSVHVLLRGLERSLVAERRANDALRETLAERARLEAAAIEGAKAKALGMLAGGIAHDLNNLLVPLLVAGDEARSAAEAGSLQRRRLEIVLASAERARVLAGRVLAFMRSVPEEQRPIALVPLVREVAGLLRSGSPASTAVEVTVAADAEEVRVDALADELHRVLMNLGSNALRAVAERPTGGTVAFELTMRRDGARELAVIEVRDDGPGVPDHVRARLFEPYVTSRPTGGGTGLGLAIVSHVVAGLGGRVSLLESGMGGSTFEVVLPASSRTDPVRATPAPAADDPTPSGPSGAPATVLVVDDEPLVRATTAMALEALGYVVVEVGSADVALARVHDAPASVDVVVSDVAMPHMAGLDLVRTLRAVRPDLPVVLMSGRVDDALSSEVEAEGVRWLLAKPFDRAALASAVAEAVGAAAR